ncbi:MAG: monovalent cation/H(+) antiporter subunit G [Spirochaetaceae bacterium]|jgi:multicomponent Na+:H+ antiporter subunit G|nr:monovalent cation/H(+) antiporter subunit G [Spirochaetaceae bacterium]
MMETLTFIRELGAVFFCAIACVAALAGSVSLFRFPDTYTRLHGAGLGATTACFSVFLGSLCVSPDLATAARIVLIILFFFISCPTATHIIARYAWYQGIDPWLSPRRKAPDPEDT